jgi:hypothetical protein
MLFLALTCSSFVLAQTLPVSTPPLVEAPSSEAASHEAPSAAVRPPPEDSKGDGLTPGKARSKHLLLAETLGGLAGLTLGVGVPGIVAAATCYGGTAIGCYLSLVLAFPGAAFIPALGVTVGGRVAGGAGGYGWALLGSTAGWVAGGLLWVLVASVARVTSLPVMAALGVACSGFAVAGAVLATELRSAATAAPPQPNEPLASARLVPWAGAGRGGVALVGAF